MEDHRGRGGRLLAVRIVAGLLALFAAVPYFGLIDLATLPGWVNQEFEWEVPLEVSWGSLFTFLVAGSFLALVVHPRRPWPAVVQLAVAGLALLVGAVAGTDPAPAVPGAVVLVSAAGLLLLTPRQLRPFPLRFRVSAPALVLAVLGAVLWLPYSLSAWTAARNGTPGDVTNGVDHWPVQGSVGLAVVILATILAVWPPARGLFRATLALTAVLIGVAVLVYSDRAGATEYPMWGVAVAVWGVLLALLVSPAERAPAGQRA